VKPFLDFLRDRWRRSSAVSLKLAFEGLGDWIGPVVDAITWILDKAADVLGFIGKIGGAIGGLFGAGPRVGECTPARTPLVGAAAGAAPLRTATYSGGAGTGPTGAAGSPPSRAG
jgi:hypothetical protein